MFYKAQDTGFKAQSSTYIYLCLMNLKKSLLLLVSCALCLAACTTADLYEKTVPLPNHEWKSDYKPEFDFIIADSTALYQPYFVIRHTEKYNYNNIWINLLFQLPGDTLRKEMHEIVLATNEKGWLGKGMDDIYEHRHQLTQRPIALKAGNYKFMLENVMREDPLQHVLNVGIRVEKLK
jgi:gliding motility-associated lipoprotein GldH